MFSAFEALISKPAPDTVVSEIPDVFVFSEVMRAKDVTGISKNWDRYKYEFAGLLHGQFWLVDMLQHIPHRQRAPLIGVEVSVCASLIQPGHASRINVITQRAGSCVNELTGSYTNIQNRSMIMTFHQLNTGLC